MVSLITKPIFWTKEFYIKKKKEGLTDQDIANLCFVSIATIYRWKKEFFFCAEDSKNHYQFVRKGMKYKEKE